MPSLRAGSPRLNSLGQNADHQARHHRMHLGFATSENWMICRIQARSSHNPSGIHRRSLALACSAQPLASAMLHLRSRRWIMQLFWVHLLLYSPESYSLRQLCSIIVACSGAHCRLQRRWRRLADEAQTAQHTQPLISDTLGIYSLG